VQIAVPLFSRMMSAASGRVRELFNTGRLIWRIPSILAGMENRIMAQHPDGLALRLVAALLGILHGQILREENRGRLRSFLDMRTLLLRLKE
jgi:hypothetical protein